MSDSAEASPSSSPPARRRKRSTKRPKKAAKAKAKKGAPAAKPKRKTAPRAAARSTATASKARRIRPLPVIGWREWVAVPELGIARLKAKADTGARTCALHAIGVRVDGDRVRFRVHPMQRSAHTTVECSAPLVGYRSVRSSSGELSRRPVILTRLVIGDRAWNVEVTLVRRDLMGFRMLLGRQALRRRLRVDPGRSFLAELPSL